MMVIPRHKYKCAEQVIENMRPDNTEAYAVLLLQ